MSTRKAKSASSSSPASPAPQGRAATAAADGPAPGDIAPDFTLPATGGGDVSLSALRGQTVVLYFYPKDDTPGCTQQAISFSEKAAEFAAAGAVVVGVSRDGMAKHEAFARKHQLNLFLASDENGAVCQAYGVWKEKSLYGRTFMGIERSTFLIDPQGRVSAVWRKVKVPGHCAIALQAIQKPSAQ